MPKAFNSETKIVNYSTYCHDIVQDLINIGYAKEIREKKPIPLGYPGWSPNNVRRLVISPEGVLIQYHTTKGMKNNKLLKYEAFDVEKAYKCFSDPEYVPMMKALESNRICSAIEEIVLLKSSVNGSLNLPSKELDLSTFGIVYSDDFIKNISRRYNRLYSISIVRGVAMRGLEAILPEFKQESFLLSEYIDEEGLGLVKSIVINKDDWYMKKPNLQPLGVDGKGYIADTKEGVLGKYFTDLLEQSKSIARENLSKDNNIEEGRVSTIKEDRTLKEVNSKLGLLSVCLKGYRLFTKLNESKRVKSNLVKYSRFPDISWISLVVEYGVNKESAKAMQIKANSLSDRDSIMKYINTSGYKLDEQGKAVIRLYFKEESNKQVVENEANTAMGYMVAGLTEGLFNVFIDCFESIQLDMPKYFNTVLRCVSSRVFYTNANCPNMLKLSKYFSKLKEVNGINDRIIAANLSLLLTFYCELFLIYGSGLKRLTSNQWYDRLFERG